MRSQVDGSKTVGLDTLAAHWSSTFDVAERALRVASGCRIGLGFAARELDQCRGRLANERATTMQLLAVLARDAHITMRARGR
jgi:hypothetical protein